MADDTTSSQVPNASDQESQTNQQTATAGAQADQGAETERFDGDHVAAGSQRPTTLLCRVSTQSVVSSGGYHSARGDNHQHARNPERDCWPVFRRELSIGLRPTNRG